MGWKSTYSCFVVLYMFIGRRSGLKDNNEKFCGTLRVENSPARVPWSSSQSTWCGRQIPLVRIRAVAKFFPAGFFFFFLSFFFFSHNACCHALQGVRIVTGRQKREESQKSLQRHLLGKHGYTSNSMEKGGNKITFPCCKFWLKVFFSKSTWESPKSKKIIKALPVDEATENLWTISIQTKLFAGHIYFHLMWNR